MMRSTSDSSTNRVVGDGYLYLDFCLNQLKIFTYKVAVLQLQIYT